MRRRFSAVLVRSGMFVLTSFLNYYVKKHNSAEFTMDLGSVLLL